MADGMTADSAAERAILALFKQKNTNIVSQEDLTSETVGAPREDVLRAVNTLLQAGRLDMYRDQAGLCFRLVSEELARRLSELSSEEKVVYYAVETAANNGIWVRDLRLRTGLQNSIVTKALKLLEGRSLIKAVKSINNKNKKLYMLFHLEPSREITGGSFYDRETGLFDDIYHSSMEECAMNFLTMRNSAASAAEIYQHTREAGVAKDHTTKEEVANMLDAVAQEGALWKTKRGSEVLYELRVFSLPFTNAYTDAPCSVCPVSHKCRPGGVVCPESCAYLTEWLEQF